MGNITISKTRTAIALAERLAEYARQAEGALSPATEKAIRCDTALFSGWCAKRDLSSLPASAETVASFIDAMAESRKPASIKRYVASLAHLHRAAGVADPTKDNAACGNDS